MREDEIIATWLMKLMIYKTNKIQCANFQELVHKPALHVMSTNIYLIIDF